MKVSGARLLAHTLASSGIEYIAGIPGHTIFPFANVVADEGLKPLLVRSEAISTFAADAYFRVSGKLMAVFAHSVPGTSNLAAGLANAYADSSAMLLIAGETARDALGRGAYQELSRQFDGDVLGFVRHLTKKSWQSHSPLQAVEQALRAMRIATTGRPGPVSLHVFQDVWEQEVEVPSWPSPSGFMIGNEFRPSADAIDRAAALIHSAKRPIILAGNGVKLSRAHESLRRLAGQIDAFVATTVTGKGSFPEDDPRSLGVVGWVGTGPANFAAREADLIIALGARLTETATSSWQPGISFDFASAKLIQNDVEVAEIGTVFPVDVALVGDARLCIDDLLTACKSVESREWDSTLEQHKAAWQQQVAELPDVVNGKLQASAVVRELRAATADRPVTVVGDVGKSHKWIVQQFETRAGDEVLSTMGAGTMGFGPCGAVGAVLGRPEAKTICWCGDGGLSMNSHVLPTVAEYQLPITFVVLDDHSFGEVANIQEDRYGRTIFSEFNGSGSNPDYRLDIAALAEACGIEARRVSAPDGLPAALEWASNARGPAVVDIVIDRRSRVPSGGGVKLPEIWKHPIHPWVRS